jgi:hypothetical protein
VFFEPEQFGCLGARRGFGADGPSHGAFNVLPNEAGEIVGLSVSVQPFAERVVRHAAARGGGTVFGHRSFVGEVQ